MVGNYLRSRKEGCQQPARNIFTSVCKQDACNCRRDVRKRHHFPDMPDADYYKEIRGERPCYRTEGGQNHRNLEHPEHYVEAQQQNEEIPHIIRQEKVINLVHELERKLGIIARRHLVVGHAAENGIGPAG